MKRLPMTGFKSVYAFNLKNVVQTKKYILGTVIPAFIIFAAVIVAMFVFEKNSLKDGSIGVVHVFNETGEYKIPSFGELAETAEDDSLDDIDFIKVEDMSAEEFAENAGDDDAYILAIQRKTEDGYSINLVKGPSLDVSTHEMKKLGEKMSLYYKMYIITLSGVKEEDLISSILPVSYSITPFGEENASDMKEIIEIVVVLAMLVILYMMVLLYGQQICQNVSIEKTSKLMETLLISLDPEALVTGKILAVITSCIMQFLVWVISLFAGLFAGNVICIKLLELESGPLTEIVNKISDAFNGAGFSQVQIILCIISAVFGLVFYLMLAGLAGSMVSKPEEAGNMQSVYIIPLIISYFLTIAMVTKGAGHVATAYYFIPFTSTMLAPGAILRGELSCASGIVSNLVVFVCAVIMMWVAARVYKGMMFFSGKKLTVKDVLSMAFGKY